MSEEEALIIWDSINELFKQHGLNTNFFHNDVSIWEKYVDGFYDLFYFEFDLDNSSDKTILGKISDVICLPELEDYRVSYSNKNYFNNDYWRLRITLAKEKN